jgi:hypothetical protein
MLKMGTKTVIALAAVLILYTCIDPYSPKLKGYGSLLVVDALITDENASYTIKLSRTIQKQNAIPEAISDAKVYITDDVGGRTDLEITGDGVYKTDMIAFRGVVGRSYILHIITREGEEFESAPCLMQAVPDIDSIHFARDTELINNGTESNDGIRIYLNSKGGANDKYYRWDFVETWKFKVPTPTRSVYVNERVILSVSDVREYCWKSKKSDDILIRRINSGEPEYIEKMPVNFIASDKSDRLMLQYDILVRQYSISRQEYEFWNNLTKVNESGDDIFAKVPYPVISNIQNINNPAELVLGYFQVSAVKQKRKEISFSDIVGFNLTFYHYPCIRIEDSPYIIPWVNFRPPLTWDDIYQMYTTSGYTFVEHKYIEGTTTLDRLVFTTPECADCELTGTREKPLF